MNEKQKAGDPILRIPTLLKELLIFDHLGFSACDRKAVRSYDCVNSVLHILPNLFFGTPANGHNPLA
jgi:hypothetical protein